MGFFISWFRKIVKEIQFSGNEEGFNLEEKAMISETFLNNCFELIFASKRQELNESVYQDALYYLNFVEKKVLDSGDVPVSVRNKFDLLKKVCEHKSNGGSMMEIVAALMLSEKFKQHESFISCMADQQMDQSEQAGRIKTIQNLVAWCKLSNTYKRFAAYNDVVINGSFDTVEDVIDEWNDMVKSAFTDVAEFELKSRNELVSSLNTCDDSLEPIIDEIRKKYSRQNVITSGIPELDQEFLSGGFQPSRVNLFLGTSGIGKSLILLNMAIRAAMRNPQGPGVFNLTGPGFDEDTPERVFLYITMENYPYETWCRLYCSMFNKTKEEMLRMIFNRSTSSESIQAEIHIMMAPFNSSIQIDYFAANTISPATISALIQKYNQCPEKRSVKAVYIDYLDLLVPDVGREFYRLDLGEITSSLK
jgi:replicative DNA helicase